MFLVNSRNPRFPATLASSRSESFHQQGHTFSRSYGVILPSSLARVLSRALGYSPCPPESVCGTVTTVTPHAAFLESMGSPSFWPQLATSSPLGVASRRRSVCPYWVLKRSPTSLNQHFHSLAGHTLLCPCLVQRYRGSAGILTCYPSPTPLGLGLGAD